MAHSIPQSSAALKAAYDEYIRVHGEKRAVTAMADDFGCTQNTVYRYLDRAGIRTVRDVPKRPAEAYFRARCEAVAAEHGKRAAASLLAAEFAVVPVTIRKWMADYGIRLPGVRIGGEPILGACPCGDAAVARYKGQDPPLCFRCYMRTRSAEEAKAGTQKRLSRNHAVNAKIGKPCTDCGRNFPACCMHWDHVPERGPKLFNLGRADVSLERVLAEIAKCDIVCANCHSIRTWNRKHPEAPVSLEPVPGASMLAVAAEGKLF